jgi:tetratricopeptide (TPR) repeat protein
VAAALLSKEVAVTWPLLCLGACWAAAPTDRIARARWRGLLAAGAGLLGGYLVLRWVVLGGLAPGGLSAIGADRIALVPITAAAYLWWLVWPFAFSFVWTLASPSGWGDPGLWGSLALLGALAGLAAWLARRHRLAAFALCWIPITLLPVMNLVPIPGFSLAQRYLYLPSVGFCILLGLGLERAWRAARQPAALLALGGAVIGLFVAYAATVQLRTAQWEDPLAISEQMAARAPASFFAQSTLGLAYLQHGRVPEALLALGRACDLEPQNPRAWNNLGVALARARRLGEARAAYERAIALSPGHARAHENLGHVLRALGLHAQAEAAFQRARTLSGR